MGFHMVKNTALDMTIPITCENMTRVETYQFPKDAVREALYNALARS